MTLILCDLGLSGFEDWRGVVDNLLDILKTVKEDSVVRWIGLLPEAMLIVESLVKWIGGGEVDDLFLAIFKKN